MFEAGKKCKTLWMRACMLPHDSMNWMRAMFGADALLSGTFSFDAGCITVRRAELASTLGKGPLCEGAEAAR